MNSELKKLEEILNKYPTSNQEACEHTLSHIKGDEAALIWKYAQQYLSVAKEMDVV